MFFYTRHNDESFDILNVILSENELKCF